VLLAVADTDPGHVPAAANTLLAQLLHALDE
jgi:hypothetical protein